MNGPVNFAGTFPQPFPQFRIFKEDAEILFLTIKILVLLDAAHLQDCCICNLGGTTGAVVTYKK